MKPNYHAFFALTREPFGSDLYAIRLSILALTTGDVSSGKFTALRWAASRLHPSEYQTFWVAAS
ncbi:hypothetical protein DFAR_1020004 [Desulfarculales bacterium]